MRNARCLGQRWGRAFMGIRNNSQTAAVAPPSESTLLAALADKSISDSAYAEQLTGAIEAATAADPVFAAKLKKLQKDVSTLGNLKPSAQYLEWAIEQARTGKKAYTGNAVEESGIEELSGVFAMMVKEGQAAGQSVDEVESHFRSIWDPNLYETLQPVQVNKALELFLNGLAKLDVTDVAAMPQDSAAQLAAKWEAVQELVESLQLRIARRMGFEESREGVMMMNVSVFRVLLVHSGLAKLREEVFGRMCTMIFGRLPQALTADEVQSLVPLAEQARQDPSLNVMEAVAAQLSTGGPMVDRFLGYQAEMNRRADAFAFAEEYFIARRAELLEALHAANSGLSAAEIQKRKAFVRSALDAALSRRQ